MGRLATLIGVLAMSVVILSYTWPMVETELAPILIPFLDANMQLWIPLFDWVLHLLRDLGILTG